MWEVTKFISALAKKINKKRTFRDRTTKTNDF